MFNATMYQENTNKNHSKIKKNSQQLIYQNSQ